MASWNDLPDPHAGDDLAYQEAWENRIRPSLAAPTVTECDLCDGTGMLEDPDDQSHGVTIYEPCSNCDGKGSW